MKKKKKHGIKRRTSYSVNRKHKDSVFCVLFGGKYKDYSLALYNALSPVPCNDVTQLEVYTLEDAVCVKHKNDVAYLVRADMRLMLTEHQSTINPNMPLRGLIYFAETFSGYVAQEEANIYGRTVVKIPTPQYVVLYNGQEETQPVVKQHLSDAFDDPSVKDEYEWTATVYNIRHPDNKGLMEACKPLYEYTVFTDTVNRYAKNHKIQTAVDLAVDECIAQGILADFLAKHRAEVRMSAITEYNQIAHEKGLIAQGVEEGIEKGIDKGIQIGELRAYYAMYQEGDITLDKALLKTGLTKAEFLGTDQKVIGVKKPKRRR